MGPGERTRRTANREDRRNDRKHPARVAGTPARRMDDGGRDRARRHGSGRGDSSPLGRAAAPVEQDYQGLQAVYDVTAGTPEALQNVLDHAAYLSRMVEDDPFDSHIVLVVHGGALDLFAREHFAAHEQLMTRARALTLNGVIEYRICQAGAARRGYVRPGGLPRLRECRPDGRCRNHPPATAGGLRVHTLGRRWPLLVHARVGAPSCAQGGRGSAGPLPPVVCNSGSRNAGHQPRKSLNARLRPMFPLTSLRFATKARLH